jgi:LPS sulfotransferase NodH
MKNLLILATPRSGSSALYQAIASNYFEYHSYYEPWSRWNPVKVEGEHIVKSLIHHKPQWGHIINAYDKVIYISRRDKDAGYRSYQQANNTRNFVDKYQPDKNLVENERIKNFYYSMHDMLEKEAKDKIWYYEDLFYSKEEVNKLIKHHDLKIRHLDRFHNYFNTKYAYEY